MIKPKIVAEMTPAVSEFVRAALAHFETRIAATRGADKEALGENAEKNTACIAATDCLRKRRLNVLSQAADAASCGIKTLDLPKQGV